VLRIAEPIGKFKLLRFWGLSREEQLHPLVVRLNWGKLVEEVCQTFAFQPLERFNLYLDQIGQGQFDIDTRV
jgi:hypothetical protein